MWGDGNQLQRPDAVTRVPGFIALDGTTVDRRLAPSRDSLWRGLFSHGGGLRPDGNSGATRHAGFQARHLASVDSDESPVGAALEEGDSTGGTGVTRYLLSFDDGAMTFPEDDLDEVSQAAHDVVSEAQRDGVWVTGAGVQSQRSSVVDVSGTVTDGPYPETKAVLGGFAIVNVASREEALKWAAKFAAACRCTQEVRELMDDPEV
jgi:hypothetical protein